MKKFSLVIVFLVIYSFLGTNPYVASAVSAKSAVLMEEKSGRVLYAKDANSPRKIASITKIMTAIIALESGKLDETVLISEEMIRTEGSSIYLKVGEKITLRDLIYGLMLRSGNDAALAIAITVGKSVPGFVHLMNEKAKWLGMENTTFTNPHGLDDGNLHMSSAYDMALLTRYAMQNADFRNVSGTKKYSTESFGNNLKRLWVNKNKMLTKYYQYSTGGKTGFTKKAGRTLVSTATRNGLDLIAVTIDAPNDWTDHMSMFDAAFTKFHLHEFVSTGMINGLGDKFYKNHLYLKSPLIYPIKDDEKNLFQLNYVLFKPEKSWEKKKNIPKIVGRVELLNGKEVLINKPIYYVAKPVKDSLATSWEKLFSLFWSGASNG